MNRAIRLGFLSLVMVGAMATAPTASAAANGTNRPFKSSGTMVGPVDFSTLNFYTVGPTIGTHFGKGTVRVDGNLGGEAFVTKTTAANGDTFTGRFAENFAGDISDIVCPAGAAPFKNYQEVTGGTGRFAGATGRSLVWGCTSLDFSTGMLTITFTTSGTISY